MWHFRLKSILDGLTEGNIGHGITIIFIQMIECCDRTWIWHLDFSITSSQVFFHIFFLFSSSAQEPKGRKSPSTIPVLASPMESKVLTRDPRTRLGPYKNEFLEWTTTKENLKISDRTRINKFLKILDQFGPVVPRTW